MSEKKYILELNEKQARLLSYACDQFSRLIMGQDWSFQELLEAAWEKRCKKATGKPMDDEWDGGWSAMREEAERTCREIKYKFWGLPSNAFNGIHYDDTANILFDIHQCLRHALWKDLPEPKSHITVDASPAMRFGSEPLAKVELKSK